MIKRRFKISSVVLVAALYCVSSACAQSISLSHGNGSNQSTLGIGPNESIVFSLGGSNLPAVDTLDFSLVVVPGDLSLGGVANPPPVVNISGLGIFSGASTVFTPASLSASSNAEASFSIPNSAALTNGAPIAEVFFDTTGLSNGDVFLYGPDATFFNAGAEFETASVLTFFGTVVAVPEPSSASFLLALGSIVLMRRKRG